MSLLGPAILKSAPAWLYLRSNTFYFLFFYLYFRSFSMYLIIFLFCFRWTTYRLEYHSGRKWKKKNLPSIMRIWKFPIRSPTIIQAETEKRRKVLKKKRYAPSLIIEALREWPKWKLPLSVISIWIRKKGRLTHRKTQPNRRRHTHNLGIPPAQT